MALTDLEERESWDIADGTKVTRWAVLETEPDGSAILDAEGNPKEKYVYVPTCSKHPEWNDHGPLAASDPHHFESVQGCVDHIVEEHPPS